MELGLKDKRVLITGSSKGIGLSIGEGFLNEGAKVVLTSRRLPAVKEVQSRLCDRFPSENILVFECDFTDPVEIENLREHIIQMWGGLDILVANVGSGKSASDTVPPKEHFDSVFRQNFDVAVNAVREILPLIKESKGNILFISSIAGIEAFGVPVDYSVAKTAVLSFSKNIARKLARDEVRVNCIAPGNVYFAGGSWDEKIKADPEKIRTLIESTVPMNRFGTPKEIADAVLFICSERASFITGVCLVVDGGQTVGIL